MPTSATTPALCPCTGLAYELESLLSPLLAAAALSVLTYDLLFVGTTLGFTASTLLVVAAVLPAKPANRGLRSTTQGLWIYLTTPPGCGLGRRTPRGRRRAIVLVNTVPYVRDVLGRGETAGAAALAANGFGSLVVALAVPRLRAAGGDTHARHPR